MSKLFDQQPFASTGRGLEEFVPSKWNIGIGTRRIVHALVHAHLLEHSTFGGYVQRS